MQRRYHQGFGIRETKCPEIETPGYREPGTWIREPLGQNLEKGSEHLGTEDTVGQCPGIQDREHSQVEADELNPGMPKITRKGHLPKKAR